MTAATGPTEPPQPSTATAPKEPDAARTDSRRRGALAAAGWKAANSAKDAAMALTVLGGTAFVAGFLVMAVDRPTATNGSGSLFYSAMFFVVLGGIALTAGLVAAVVLLAIRAAMLPDQADARESG